jgi:hypothetical protein
MKKKTPTHIIHILSELLQGKSLCSNDIFASNSNQYFNTIKHQGIELIEVWKPNLTNSGKHKDRRLNQTIENIKKAEQYLNKLRGKL